MIGAMGAMRTGNMIFDMMIAMMVPYFFKMIMDSANDRSVWENLRSVIFFWSPYYTREIEHKILQTSWGGTINQDRDLRNNVLIKAIQLYLDEQKVEYRNANLQLMSTKQNDSFWPWDDDDGDGENTPAGKLKRFKVARKPPKHRWTPVTACAAASLNPGRASTTLGWPAPRRPSAHRTLRSRRFRTLRSRCFRVASNKGLQPRAARRVRLSPLRRRRTTRPAPLRAAEAGLRERPVHGCSPV